jgi:hypothetical protein
LLNFFSMFLTFLCRSWIDFQIHILFEFSYNFNSRLLNSLSDILANSMSLDSNVELLGWEFGGETLLWFFMF